MEANSHPKTAVELSRDSEGNLKVRSLLDVVDKKKEKALTAIFEFYSKQHVHTGLDITIEERLRDSQLLRQGEFLKML